MYRTATNRRRIVLMNPRSGLRGLRGLGMARGPIELPDGTEIIFSRDGRTSRLPDVTPIATPVATLECEHAAPPEGCYWSGAGVYPNCGTLVCASPRTTPVALPPNPYPIVTQQIPTPTTPITTGAGWVDYLSQYFDLTADQKQKITAGGINQPASVIGALAPKGSTPNSNYVATPSTTTATPAASGLSAIPLWGWVVGGLVGWAVVKGQI
jgi:hypothetical protein